MGEIIDLIAKQRHPYKEHLQSLLNGQKRMLELLEKRMSIKSAFRDEYERNEHEILLIKTQGEINAIKKSIAIKEKYFIEWAQQFLIDLDECEKHWENVMDKAKTSKDKTVQGLYSKIVWDAVNSDVEVKVDMYNRFKKMV